MNACIHVYKNKIMHKHAYIHTHTHKHTHLQAQYVFIHDALNELITCGETDIPASTLRTKVNLLSKVKPGRGITGYANQFDVSGH